MVCHGERSLYHYLKGQVNGMYFQRGRRERVNYTSIARDLEDAQRSPRVACPRVSRPLSHLRNLRVLAF